eukprot:UN20554
MNKRINKRETDMYCDFFIAKKAGVSESMYRIEIHVVHISHDIHLGTLNETFHKYLLGKGSGGKEAWCQEIYDDVDSIQNR